mgnify:CR=1 FL=1
MKYKAALTKNAGRATAGKSHGVSSAPMNEKKLMSAEIPARVSRIQDPRTVITRFMVTSLLLESAELSLRHAKPHFAP